MEALLPERVDPGQPMPTSVGQKESALATRAFQTRIDGIALNQEEPHYQKPRDHEDGSQRLPEETEGESSDNSPKRQRQQQTVDSLDLTQLKEVRRGADAKGRFIRLTPIERWAHA